MRLVWYTPVHQKGGGARLGFPACSEKNASKGAFGVCKSEPMHIGEHKMTKADAIREATRTDPSLSNEQIKTIVRQRFNLNVRSNQINNLLGPYCKRKHLGMAGQHYLTLARQFLAGFGGDKRMASAYLNLA